MIRYILFSIVLSITSTFSVANEHQWSETELILLKSLSIEYTNKNQPDEKQEAISLGHNIFFDPRFSRNGKISCASCHQPKKYFTDGLETAQGLKKTQRNTPTIVGSSHNTWFFHDGRADSLWAQALGPLENDLEHGGSRNQFAHIVFNDPSLRKQYEAVFDSMPDISDKKRFPLHAGPVKNIKLKNTWEYMRKEDQKTITQIFVNIGKALSAYEKQIQPAASRFDHYVKAANNNDAEKMNSLLSSNEVAGLKVFINKGNCTLCHNGPMLTDSGFHNIATPARKGKPFDWGRYSGAQAVLKSPFNCRSNYNTDKNKQCNELEYIVLDKHETLGSMKTPGLRNISRTAPYMHAGQHKTLREVLEHYNDPPSLSYRKNDLFLDIDLNEKELNQLEAFLHTLDSPVSAHKSLLKKPRNMK